MIDEVPYACPHCGEPVSALVDTSQALQDYIEDCEVCCRPVRLRVAVEAGEVDLQAEIET